MSIFKIKSLHGQAESTFSTAPNSGAFSGTTRIPGEKMTFDPGQTFIARDAQTDALGQNQSGLIGAKGGSVKLTTEIPGAATPGTSAVAAAAQAWMSLLMRSSSMVETADTGCLTAATTHTPTSVVCATGGGANFSVGSLVGLLNSTTGLVEVRMVSAISTDTLTITPALSFTPSSAGGATVFASVRWVVQEPTAPGTLTLIGKGDGFEYTFTGCRGKPPKVAGASAAGRPMLDWEFEVDSWTITTTTGSLIAMPTSKGIIALGSQLHYGTSGTSTPVQDVTFDPGATVVAQASTEGLNGRSGFKLTGMVAKASFKPYLSSTFRTNYSAGTETPLIWQLGNAAGAIFAFGGDKSQVEKYPNEADVVGLVGHNVDVKFNASAFAGVPVTLAVL